MTKGKARMVCARTKPVMVPVSPMRARVWTQSHPEHVDCSKCDSIEERSGQLVVAGGNTAKVLEAADGRLDPPALLVASAIVADRLLPIASAGDDWPGAGLTQLLAEGVGIVGTVGDQVVERSDLRHEVVGRTDVGLLARAEQQPDRPADDVHGDVNLRAPPTSGYANRLIFRLFFFAPAAERWAFT